MPEVDLMTTTEVAEMYRAKESTLRYWRHIGVGPEGFRIGRRVVYRREDVVRWLNEQQAADRGGISA